MKTFHCTHCQGLVFFENIQCLGCKQALAYVPEQRAMVALGAERPEQGSLRLCANYEREKICNWAVGADDPNALCVSCRLTEIIPDLGKPRNRIAWFQLEQAKRRLIDALLGFRLPIEPKLRFHFLEDSTLGDALRVLTGHDNGLITVNVAEADDVWREQQRTRQREPYRTLLGHFRHEIGHYYWDRLIGGAERVARFRKLFGDEQASYAESLERHYRHGPPESWEESFISAYATTHPWEDWAETWAHYFHMADALETASAIGLKLEPRRPDEPETQVPPDPLAARERDFDEMLAAWFPLTYVLNNLNRGLGLPDAYPFVLSTPVIEKLRFVHHTIGSSRA